MSSVNSIDPIHIGFLPKRQESFEDYEQRCKEKILTSENLKSYFSKSEEEPLISDALHSQALVYFEQKTSLFPHWACVIYSNRGLGWLHLGALVEIEPTGQEIKKASFVQLHNRWKKSDFCWGYNRTKVIAHEWVHLLRYELEDEKYEEFIACQFEEKSFRRLGGPLFSTPSSARIIMLSLLSLTFSLACLCLMPEWLSHAPEWGMNLSWITLFGSLSMLGILFFQYIRKTYCWLQFSKKGKKRWKKAQNFLLFSILIYSEDLENLSQLKHENWSCYLKKIPRGPYQSTLERLWENAQE